VPRFNFWADQLKPVEWVFYALRDPRDGAIRYIGKTMFWGQRRMAHLGKRQTGTRAKLSWLRDLSAAGLKPDMIELERGEYTWRSSSVREMVLVRRYQNEGCSLLNQEALRP
jgi:hypothetical protein